MGPPQAEDALREALALGADDAVLLSDRKFAGSDTIATSYVLANAIKKLGNFDLVLCGREALDGNTAQIGPQIAELLNLPQLTYAKKIEINNDKITVHRALEDNIEIVETELPALVTVIKDINIPRYMSLKGILNSSKKEVKILTADDINIDESKLGLKGSPTWVKKSFLPPQKAKGEFIEGSPKEVAKILVQKLKDNNII
jgi:electron transfer flavoprotein beta subunit